LDDEEMTSFREPVPTTGFTSERLRRAAAVIIGPDVTNGVRLELCRGVWAASRASITVISNELDEADELRLAVAGACAIHFLPVRPRVLAAQIASRIQRFQTELSDQVLSFRGLHVHPGEHVVTVEDRALELTKTEFELLMHLMRNPRRVHTHAALSRWLWDDDSEVDHHRLEAHISRLRKKVAQGGGPSIASSVRGVGYRLMTDVQVADAIV
jgi:DNA-binding response OmpR family regulator